MRERVQAWVLWADRPERLSVSVGEDLRHVTSRI